MTPFTPATMATSAYRLPHFNCFTGYSLYLPSFLGSRLAQTKHSLCLSNSINANLPRQTTTTSVSIPSISCSKNGLSFLIFKVQRGQPELIRPAEPTPHEFKYLSNIDDQECLRLQIPFIQFYKKDEKMDGKDPVKVIRDAIGRTLVYYYPFAGRLRERLDRKLVVECTGEGVMFIEASANVTLDQFGDALLPPFPGFEDLLYNVPGSSDILNCPLLLIQVTRLMCGGFIFALRLNHTMSDGAGVVQFLSAVCEMARGKNHPSIEPVWNRELLNARSPPRVTCIHTEFDQAPNTKRTLHLRDDMTIRSFLFGPQEMIALRKQLPHHLRNSTTFEVLIACIWRCRTIALTPDPNDEMRVIFPVNCRKKFNPPLPIGYYGNAVALPAAVTAAGKLCEKPLEYALDLVKKAKAQVTQEYMRSVVDLLAIRGRPHFIIEGTFFVTDNTQAGYRNLDFGWGKAVYGGPAAENVGPSSGMISFYVLVKNSKGEDAIGVPIYLPAPAMEKFVLELDMMLRKPATSKITSVMRVSAL